MTTTTVGCAAVTDAERQALGVTFEFDARPDGDPYPLRSASPAAEPVSRALRGPRDTFMVVETIDRGVRRIPALTTHLSAG